MIVLATLAGCQRLAVDSSRPAVDWARYERDVAATCACKDEPCFDGVERTRYSPDQRGLDKTERRRAFDLDNRRRACLLSVRMHDDVTKVKAWADEMCACTAPDCAAAVEQAMAVWARDIWDRQNWALLGPVYEIAGDAVDRLDGCHAKHFPPPAVPAQLPGETGELATRLADATNRICKCSTNACADRVDHQFHEWWTTVSREAWGQRLIDASPGARARYNTCFARVARFPHDARIGR